MQGTGLEEVGIVGQAYLRDALTSCTDPLLAIEEFQVRFNHSYNIPGNSVYNVSRILARKWNKFAFATSDVTIARFARCATIGVSYVCFRSKIK